MKPYFSGILIPAPYTEYEAKSQPLPETMFIRRPQLENLLRRLVLGFRSNVRTLVGTVRGLEAKQGPTARISAIIVRTGNGEISIKDPTMVVGAHASHPLLAPSCLRFYRCHRLFWR